ncbi:hypothetical protein M514_08487 [Trichuris suis]|uniref:Uncharacterized protein n=1 Tax=Trichuris suis TaxID=68888 RepID=A0A085MVP6_9BILA|nr:hypothetical protein M513_08487 [Trichuris suis]KFD61292.1 hypothetical protein M514_08487 [Trichuris suis]
MCSHTPTWFEGHKLDFGTAMLLTCWQSNDYGVPRFGSKQLAITVVKLLYRRSANANSCIADLIEMSMKRAVTWKNCLQYVAAVVAQRPSCDRRSKPHC